MSIFSRKGSTNTIDPVFDAGTSAVGDLSGDYTLDASHSRLGFPARPVWSASKPRRLMSNPIGPRP